MYQTDKNYSTGSSVSSWSILPSGGVELIQEFTFTLSQPGTNPDRQDAPHPHEVLVDPTDSFILVPDLGADLVRVFSIDPATSKLNESTPFNAVPGSGPRHGSFLTSGNTTYFFLVAELGNTVTSYTVTYGKGTLTFNEVFTSDIFGNEATPEGAAAAECILSVGFSPAFPHFPPNTYQKLTFLFLSAGQEIPPHLHTQRHCFSDP
jgi:6-phosphogluconolactonase (cycloisomerase 2 family)